MLDNVAKFANSRALCALTQQVTSKRLIHDARGIFFLRAISKY